MKPCPKPYRIVDKKLVDSVRAYGKCMLEGYSECTGGLDIHHVNTRGSGAGDTEDNLTLLCRGHHTQAHTGKISKQLLKDRLARIRYLWYNCNKRSK